LRFTLRGACLGERDQMAKRRLHLWGRIEMRREKGHSPAEIARYVHNSCGLSWSKKRSWTLAELEELERLDRGVSERKAKKAADGAEAAARHAARLSSLSPRPPAPPNLGRAGLSPMDVRDNLGCTRVELDRWAADGRLCPDGTKYYHNVGGAKKVWGRAWHYETVDNAKAHVDEWRARDAEMVCRWRSQAALFDLLRSRFPDSVSPWLTRWLGRLSVDIYVPSINVAFEYQGEQHYKPIDFFGGVKSFRATQVRDARKRELLARHGVHLVEWRYDTPIARAELDRALAFLTSRDATMAGIDELTPCARGQDIERRPDRRSEAGCLLPSIERLRDGRRGLCEWAAIHRLPRHVHP
jgi:hypothetical protein